MSTINPAYGRIIFCKLWFFFEYIIIKRLIKEIDILFIFILFVILLGFCLFLYVYLTNEILSQRKRIMLLINQNNELKKKLDKALSTAASSKADNTEPIELPEEIKEASKE